MQFQPIAHQLGDGQQLDLVPHLLGVANIGDVERVDPGARNVLPMHAGAEGQVRENRQFLGGVGAVDIHRRVGFGVAQPLGLGKHVGVRCPLSCILRKDEVARAVEDADAATRSGWPTGTGRCWR